MRIQGGWLARVSCFAAASARHSLFRCTSDPLPSRTGTETPVAACLSLRTLSLLLCSPRARPQVVILTEAEEHMAVHQAARMLIKGDKSALRLHGGLSPAPRAAAGFAPSFCAKWMGSHPPTHVCTLPLRACAQMRTRLSSATSRSGTPRLRRTAWASSWRRRPPPESSASAPCRRARTRSSTCARRRTRGRSGGEGGALGREKAFCGGGYVSLLSLWAAEAVVARLAGWCKEQHAISAFANVWQKPTRFALRVRAGLVAAVELLLCHNFFDAVCSRAGQLKLAPTMLRCSRALRSVGVLSPARQRRALVSCTPKCQANAVAEQKAGGSPRKQLRSLAELNWDHTFTKELPCDPLIDNKTRKVVGYFSSLVDPTPTNTDPRTVIVSEEVSPS